VVDRRSILSLSLVALLVACREPTTPPVRRVPDPVAFTAHGSQGLLGVACTHHWGVASSGSWTDPANWTPQEVPTDTAVACIDADGTYTVTLNRDNDVTPVVVAGLLVGPATGHATLDLTGNSLTLSSTNGVDVHANGEVRLGASAGAGVQLTTAGAIDNDGTIYAARLCPSCGATDAISGNISNHGTFHVATTLSLSATDGSFTNTSSGSVVIDAGGEVVVPTGIGAPSVTFHAGSLSGEGHLTVQSGTVVYNDGTLGLDGSGSPVLQLNGASLALGAPQTVAAAIRVVAQPASDVSVTGNVGSTTDLFVDGAPATLHSTVTLVAAPVVSGRLILRADAGDTLQLTGSSGLTNNGTMIAGSLATSVTQLSLGVLNSGTTTLGGSLVVDAAGGSFTNNGTVGGTAGLAISVEPTATFVNGSSGAVTTVSLTVHGGILRGEGTVEAVSNSSGGTVTPGSSVGALTIGQFTQDATSTLSLDVSAIATPAGYDRLVISGGASLAGQLEVLTAPSFTGGICGETFDVLTVAGAISGTFSSVAGGIDATRAWRAAYVPNAVRLAGYDPTVPLNITGLPTDLAEGGGAASYNVCLGPTPTAAVTVAAAPDAQLTVTPASIVFNTATAALPQTFAVQAVDDANAEGPHSGVVQHTASSADPAFEGQTHQVTVPITDNDNSPPSAVADDAVVDEDQSVVVPVLANDSDVEHDALTVTGVTQPAHGSAVISNGATNVTYTPTANYHGGDSFTYTVTDAAGGSADATVTVTVQSVNDVPVAVDDAAAAISGVPTTVPVLSNDTDADGHPLTVTQVSTASHGTVSIAVGAQGVVYTAVPHYGGPDSFTYTISDGAGGTATATVNVTVTATDQAPIAGDDNAVTDEDTPVSISVLLNDSDPDGDPLSISQVTSMTGGTAVISGQDVLFTPALNFNGTATLSYTVSDGLGGQATATVTVTVQPVNDAPVAANDAVTTNEDTQVVISVLQNDNDVDGDQLVVSQVSFPANGIAVITGGGTTVTYTPSPNYNGPDSFSYTVSDGHGGQASATVTLDITPVNDAPFVLGDTATTWKNWKIMVPVLANDSDIEGDSIFLQTINTPSKGTASNFHDQIFYNPGSFVGQASVTYKARDSKGAISSLASLNLTVLPTPPATDMSFGTITYSAFVGGPTGHQFTLTVTYVDGGNATAPDITVTVDQVTGLKFRSTFKGDRCATMTSGIVACERPALAGNSSATFALLHFTAVAAGNYTLNLHINAPNPDPNSSNNNKTVVVHVP